MRKLFLLTFLLTGSLISEAQNQYLIYLKDKGPEATYYRNHPEKILSEKAIQRRQKHRVFLKEEDFPVSTSYLKQLQENGTEIKQKSKWLNAVYIESNLSAAQLGKRFGFIKTIRNYGPKPENSTIAKYPEPEDSNPNARLNYGASAMQIDQLNLDCMHNKGYQGKGVLIAVFDTGFPGVNTVAAYDSLRRQNRILATRNFVSKPTTVYGSYLHGSFVLSIMAGNRPGVYVGAAAQATYALAITENMASETHQEELNWAAAAEWADSLGADIIQSSLSYKYFDAGQGDYGPNDIDGNTPIITRAADKAAQKGILVVNGAGNDGDLTAPLSPHVGAPCDGDSVLCVGSVNLNNQYSSFSSRGPTADNRIKPDVVARGGNTQHLNVPGNVSSSDGTSVAAPLISSIAAALFQANPGATNMQVYQAIKQSADKFTSPNNQFGWGLPDACKADSLLKITTGIKKSASKPAVNVYPTVFEKEIRIETGMQTEIISAELYAVSGRKLLVFDNLKTDAQLVLPVTENLPAGLYLLRLQTADKLSLQFKLMRK